MVKVMRMPMRAVAMLAGVSLVIAAAVAGGGPAVAAGRAVRDPGPRAPALAQILRHGVGLRPGGTGLRHSGVSAAALPGGGRKVPQPGNSSVLNGVFCTSAANCWAVGTYTPSAGNGGRNEVLHWNGGKWSQIAVANPGGMGTSHLSELFAVRCISARDCWTVGFYSHGSADLNQALHWNGRKWSLAATPTPGGILSGDVNQLFDVVCTSSASCWAGGDYGSESSSSQTFLNEILHWNGKAWSLVHVLNPSGKGFDDVQAIDAIRCTAARSCLAVGTYGNVRALVLRNEALHWNGTKWSKLATPNPGGTGTKGDVSELAGLGCANASNCWAAGTYGNLSTQTFLNEILHWNGRKWSQQTTPDPDGTGTGAGNQLFAASCTSATSCWAVGYYGSLSGGTGVILNEALHWNGRKWSLTATPNPAGTASLAENQLLGVRCSSASRCWTVGGQAKSGDSEVNQALHWNGTRWSTG
jgi:hypothetical protein